MALITFLKMSASRGIKKSSDVDSNHNTWLKNGTREEFRNCTAIRRAKPLTSGGMSLGWKINCMAPKITANHRVVKMTPKIIPIIKFIGPKIKRSSAVRGASAKGSSLCFFFLFFSSGGC